MGIDLGVPPVGQLPERAHVILVTMGEHDGRRTNAPPKSPGSGPGDPARTTGETGIDESPPAIAGVGTSVEIDVDEEMADIGQIRSELDDSHRWSHPLPAEASPVTSHDVW